MSELELKNLTVGYNKKPLISDINMLVKQGKIVVIIGPNGVGKSTILRTVAGSLAAVSGNVLLDGKSLSDILSRSIMVDNETYDNILEARIHKYE